MRHTSLLIVIFIFSSCHRPIFKEKWLKEKAPEHFTASFETSRGWFEAAFTRAWSPMAVDRLFAQIKHGYYNHTLFYRVRPGYVAQFGGDDSLRMSLWKKIKIPDEPVLQPNTRGAISYARSGKDTRDNDLFINLQNNSPRLDTINTNGVKGFPVIGRVTKNMQVVDSLYSGYSDRVFEKYNLLLHNKQAFLQQFPKLDSLKRVLFLANPSKEGK